MEDSKEVPPPERVWYTETRTINLGNYESIKIELGYATSPQGSELIQDTMKRCRKEVQSSLDVRTDWLRKHLVSQ